MWIHILFFPDHEGVRDEGHSDVNSRFHYVQDSRDVGIIDVGFKCRVMGVREEEHDCVGYQVLEVALGTRRRSTGGVQTQVIKTKRSKDVTKNL